MAEISTPQKSPRVDLTPMVDLGFLLITFFVFTASLQKPVALKLFLPNDHTDVRIDIPESKTLSLVIGDNNVGIYKGNNLHDLLLVNNNVVDVRKLIIDHRNTVRKKFGSAQDAIILLKPTTACNYKQLVDCLDEMTINE